MAVHFAGAKQCLLSSAAIFVVAAVPLLAQTSNTNALPPMPDQQKFHLYLLMGQSNMAGRGDITPEDLIPDPRVLVFTEKNVWQPAQEPITRDRKTDLGVGPGLSFAKTMADKNSGITIGLIPCAVGGTPLQRWQKGGDLYERALKRAALAAPSGLLKGILWHQGESDSTSQERAGSYSRRLVEMVRDLRHDLGDTNLPFVAGKLGEFLYTSKEAGTPFASQVNEALEKLPAEVPSAACVDSHRLKDKGDEVHFDAPSQHEFGRRYAQAMLRLQSASHY